MHAALVRRVVILATAATTLGALLVTGIAANPATTALSDPSSPVGVKEPFVNVEFSEQVSQIPANGIAQRVADIDIYDNDTDYDVRVEGDLSFTFTGNFVGPCNGSPSYSIVPSYVPGNFPSDFERTKIGELHLTFPSTADNTCAAFGAVLQVTFTALGPNVDD